NFLTPRADISFAGLDEFAIRKKIIESQTTKINTDISKSKTSQTVGNTNENHVEKPKPAVSTLNTNREKVIIKDWYSDDEDDVPEVSPVKTKETQTVKTRVDTIGQIFKKARLGFKKRKSCFVCKSTDHLIKDCDFYDKKSPEPKLKNVVNTSQRVVKPVRDGVLTRTGLVILVRPNGKRVVHAVSTASPINTARPVSTARQFTPKIAQTGTAIRPVYPRMDNDHAVVDSGCSSHMTGNKAYLSYYEDYNGGFVAFGNELNFNLFSASQMCDKKNSVLFTETECLILSPSFKLLDESQVVLRAPRKDDVYSLDLKNIVPSGVRGLPLKVFMNDHTCVACKKGVYQIVRENGTNKIYIRFGAMLKDISRDDLTELYRLVMQRYGTIRPEDEYERVFWGDLKTMFDPPLSTDPVWSLPGQQKMLSWRYYDTYRVHCLNLESADIYMLRERRYPLPANVCQAMLDKKLQGDKRDEACYELLKLIEKQAQNMKGLKFSGKITPLFPNMLTHVEKGKGYEEPTEPQPIPSPTQPSTEDQPLETSSSNATTQDSRDSLEGTNGNEGDQVQTPHDSPLSGGHTSDRAEGALNLHELSVFCTNLSNRVLALESIKDAKVARR
ncbi:hypothetical protein Tco_0175355, partial [Tanacetum coccineum]